MKPTFLQAPLTRIIASQQKQMLALLLLWVVVQYGLYISLGVRPVLESTKYINEANSLLQTGWFSAPRHIFYGFTSSVIALCLKLHWGFEGVVVIQLLMNLLATLFFFKTLYLQQTQKWAAFTTTAFLILCLPYQSWNFYLYTESFFYSNALLFVSACIYGNRLTGKIVLLQFVLLLPTIFSRPLGILFLPCWVFYLIINTTSKQIRYWLTGMFVIAILVFAFVVDTIMSTIGDWQILSSAAQNQLICDMPGEGTLQLNRSPNQSPLKQLTAYLLNHPAHFVQLALKRIALFFLLVRNYYSQLHNIALIIFVILLYAPIVLILFIAGIRIFFNKKTILLTCIVLGFVLSVALQCDDYHSRFHHTLIPVFLYTGMYNLMNLYNIKRKKFQ